MPDTADLERLLRAVGLRVTRPRVAVLDAVHAQPHLDTESL
ncbi:MAG TPA: transcriptional repressor, partial [Mycobacteriales bacterium]|nr:transcriptional repressor [Mycobacteriales bacterium]